MPVSCETILTAIEVKEDFTLTEEEVYEFWLKHLRNPTGKIEKPKFRKMFHGD